MTDHFSGAKSGQKLETKRVISKGAKYPESTNRRGERPHSFFRRIITFHFPPEKNPRILDPTCGKKHSWKDFRKSQTTIGNNKIEPTFDDYDIVFSDIEDFGQDIVCDVSEIKEKVDGSFDGIYYDPPFFFGVDENTDPTSERMGESYDQDFDSFDKFVKVANSVFPNLLNPDGKLVLKCSDQYVPNERKFYPLHIYWVNNLDNFDLIDLFVHKYIRACGTAYQVRNRPCSVIQHFYFLVLTKGAFT